MIEGRSRWWLTVLVMHECCSALVVQEVSSSGVVLRSYGVNGSLLEKKKDKTLRTLFVPSGTKIAPEYIAFQRWHIFQDVATQLRATLATTAVFAGLGLGNGATRAAAAATAVFLSRDLCGSVTSLVAASALAPRLSGDARRWRFLGDVSVDVALLLELLSARGQYLPLFLCSAAMLKAFCGVAAGGANAAIAAYFARSTTTNDFAEVNAKSNAVTTVSGLLGLGLSLVATRAVVVIHPRVRSFGSVVAYAVLTAAHLIACDRGLKLLAFTSIGCIRRFEILYDSFRTSSKVPTPADLAKLDPVARLPLRNHLFPVVVPRKPGRLFSEDDDTRFFHRYNYLLTPVGKNIAVALGVTADAKTERRALVHAIELSCHSSSTFAELRDAVAPSEAHLRAFEAALQAAGFHLDPRILPPDLVTLRILQD